MPAVAAVDFGTGVLDHDLIGATLGGIDADDVTAAFDTAASAAERLQGDDWVSATKAVPLPDMLTILLAVVDENFAAYFARVSPSFRPSPVRREFEPVAMPNDESWLFRPCLSDPPLIDMLALYDGRARIEHVAKANDILDVQAENDARATKVAERKR